MAKAVDSELLTAAQALGRILVTRDRDFGSLVFAQSAEAGVIYLRISPAVIASVHAELMRVLEVHTQDELEASFVVVEPGRHRIRRLGSP
jgi:predicted nuclease of predicted toxin-antitoxin system